MHFLRSSSVCAPLLIDIFFGCACIKLDINGIASYRIAYRNISMYRTNSILPPSSSAQRAISMAMRSKNIVPGQSGRMTCLTHHWKCCLAAIWSFMHHFNVCDVLSAAKACWEHALNWALGLKPASCQNGEITKCGFAGNDYSLWLGLSVLKVSRVSLWTIRSIVPSWCTILLALAILWPQM